MMRSAIPAALILLLLLHGGSCKTPSHRSMTDSEPRVVEEDLRNVWLEERTLSEQSPEPNLGIAPIKGGAMVSCRINF